VILWLQNRATTAFTDMKIHVKNEKRKSVKLYKNIYKVI